MANICGVKYQKNVKTMEGDSYDFVEWLLKSFTKTLFKGRTYIRDFKNTSVEVKNVGKEPIYETQKDLHGLDVNGLHFNFSGVDGIYVLDHVAFRGSSDHVYGVNPDGGMYTPSAYGINGFVPVLRRRDK